MSIVDKPPSLWYFVVANRLRQSQVTCCSSPWVVCLIFSTNTPDMILKLGTCHSECLRCCAHHTLCPGNWSLCSRKQPWSTASGDTREVSQSKAEQRASSLHGTCLLTPYFLPGLLVSLSSVAKGSSQVLVSNFLWPSKHPTWPVLPDHVYVEGQLHCIPTME